MKTEIQGLLVEISTGEREIVSFPEISLWGGGEEVVFWLELRVAGDVYLFSRCQSVSLCVDVE